VSEVVVIGGGPAGLSCALELRRLGISEVVVVERERRAGGIPRHCAHQGFGLRDLYRTFSGPRYAERYVDAARSAGVQIHTETMVTGWSPDGGLRMTGPDTREDLRPHAVVLATGCRERPRAARLVPGARPPRGVLTTGLLQQLVALRHHDIGTRALVVGAEHVSFSAVLTLAHAGLRTLGMLTELPRHQSLAVAPAAMQVRFRVPLWTRTALVDIRGRERVEEVELQSLDTGGRRVLACDTVVFTADWIPDHELAVAAGIELDAGTRGPRVDAGLRMSLEGTFAAGNLLQGAEPADVAALSGRHVAKSVVRWLEGDRPWPTHVPVLCRDPLAWISPNAVSSREPPPRGRFALRSSEFLERPRVEIRQNGRTIWTTRVRKLIPGRSTYLPSDWLAQVHLAAGPIAVEVTQAH
jgi:NADPH-dependent 2,4-dienoyl-CoA reductase/sulfur reductase-like enzyme